MALTATATVRVQHDIISGLRLSTSMLYKHQTTFNRPNLTYKFQFKRGKEVDVADVARLIRNSSNASTIVYVLMRKLVDELVHRFKQQGLRAVGYHAEMPMEARKQAHMDFITDKAQVIVGTIAFGMGIDKPDIRQVIHYGLPKTIEAYYQQTGRAGRDGLPSTCTCIWSNAEDVQFLTGLLQINGQKAEANARNVEALAEMARFAGDNETCRRKAVLAYFGEHVEDGSTCERIGGEPCDVCLSAQTGRTNTKDFAPEVRLVLQTVMDAGRFGASLLADWLLGKMSEKFKRAQPERYAVTSYGKGQARSAEYWKKVIKLVEDRGLLERIKVGSGFAYVYGVADAGARFMSRPPSEKLVWVVPDCLAGAQLAAPRAPSSSAAAAASSSSPSSSAAPRKGAVEEALQGSQLELLEVLKRVRKEAAERASMAPYMVFHDVSLKEMCVKLPRTAASFVRVWGCGDLKLKMFGEPFMRAIRDFCVEHPQIEAMAAASAPLVHPPAPRLAVIAQVAPAAAPAAKAKEPGMSAWTSFELFESGMSLQEIVEERAAKDNKRLAPGTVVGHLVACWEAGEGRAWDCALFDN